VRQAAGRLNPLLLEEGAQCLNPDATGSADTDEAQSALPHQQIEGALTDRKPSPGLVDRQQALGAAFSLQRHVPQPWS
jgi:hypothetical protein